MESSGKMFVDWNIRFHDNDSLLSTDVFVLAKTSYITNNFYSQS